MSRDVLVGDIRTAVHPHSRDQRIPWRRLEPLVGDQNGLDRQPLSRAEHQFLHVPGGSVGINPDPQAGFTPMLVSAACASQAANTYSLCTMPLGYERVATCLSLTSCDRGPTGESHFREAPGYG